LNNNSYSRPDSENEKIYIRKKQISKSKPIAKERDARENNSIHSDVRIIFYKF
jgi:hypothetical protein